MPSPHDAITVLIVDDDTGFAEALAVMVERVDGFLVTVKTNDGEEALRLSRQDPPDVAIVDLQMPNVSGFEVLKRLKARAPLMLRIAMTGDHGLDVQREALEAGADEVMLKDELLSRLGSRLRQVEHEHE